MARSLLSGDPDCAPWNTGRRGRWSRRSRSLLIGESANAEDLAAIRRVLDASPAVERIVDLRTMHLGPDDILVAARVELDAALDADEAGACIEHITTAIRSAVPEAQRIYIEPEPGTVP